MMPAPALPSSEPLPPRPAPEQLEVQRQRALRQVEQQYRSDLLQGGTMAVAGALLWALHVWGRRRTIPAEDAWGNFLGRTHLAFLLALFGVVGLISLPLGVYQFLRFVLVSADEFAPREPPGETVATAIVFVPLWLLTLAAAVREARRDARPGGQMGEPR